MVCMLHAVKKRLYFIGAHYFSFWASQVLKRWDPTVIVVTGSAGKTTLLHLIEAQLGEEAHYSHHANSAYGVPFDILQLHGIEHSRSEWLKLFLAAPLRVFKKARHHKLYVVEVDADRPREGKFLAQLLKPNITLWVSALHTHAAQFDAVVGGRGFSKPEEAIAYEYGHLLEHTKKLVILNGDNELMVKESARTTAEVKLIHKQDLSEYRLDISSTKFVIAGKTYSLPALLPKAAYYQVAMTHTLLETLQKEPDYNYMNYQQPPGRSNILRGIKGSTIIDSTYNNSNIESLATIVEMFEIYPADGAKWAVIGDMLEQGNDEAEEHKKIVEVLEKTHFDRIILVGPRIVEYTVPLLSANLRERTKVTAYETPRQVLDDLLLRLQGGETIMFKGVRFLEGVIEQLLADKEDADKLVRRGGIWKKHRSEWGI